MALLTYQSESVEAEIPTVRVGSAGVERVGASRFAADQAFQIAVLSDFCNECGNCVTACPTSGRPYVDKPRLYLNRDEFEAESDNAFMLFSDSSIESRIDGETHRLSLNGSVEYTTPDVVVHLDAETFEFIDGTRQSDAVSKTVSLLPAATMFTIMKGLSGSMPHIPVVPLDSSGGTLVGHPGYAD